VIPPVELTVALSQARLVPVSAHWVWQDGGRTNQVWRVENGASSLICKLYREADGNPLFPNLATAEYAALVALDGSKLAPEPVASLATGAGHAVLYRHLAGVPWRSGVEPVANLLWHVHSQPPHAGLRQLLSGATALRQQISSILASCHERDWAFEMPDYDIPPVDGNVLIHTDVVANNIVATENGLRLIDWQCPALGDGCEDLASFLSPAMQHLYGIGPLDRQQVETFLAAYPDQRTTDRYRRLAVLFHLRIAAYCQWKIEQGDRAYRPALALELSAVNQVERDKNHTG